MIRLTDIFERVAVLNLDSRDDRRKRMTAQLEAGGLADPAKVVWQRAVNGNICPAPAWFVSGNGAWGCLMSHYEVLSTAAMDRVESLLILEDDAVFCPEAAAHLQRLWREWPQKWGQIYLGGQHLDGAKPAAEAGLWFEGTNVNRTHCHAFHRTTMQEALRHILHAPDYIAANGNWHVDHQFGKAHGRGDWPVFASRWWLAGQEAGVSNISSRLLPEMWWQAVPEAYVPPVVLIPEGVSGAEAEASGQVHFGNSPEAGTCRDTGMATVVRDPRGLGAYLNMLAAEALLHRRLPAVQHADLSEEALETAWGGPCHACGPEDWQDLNRQSQRKFYDLTLLASTREATA